MDLIVGVLEILIMLSSSDLIQGLKRGSRTQQVDVAVKFGEEASLQCPLSYSADVLQVMWQKILPEVTIAGCHDLYGHKLNPQFSTKIRLRNTTVRNCSIVIQNVTEQDEGCYRCLFITSSDVANAGRACLHMCELHEPVLSISRSSSSEELLVSCSATGRPAPVVVLHVQQTIWTHSNTVLNSNGTVTVITTAALSRLHMNTTHEYKCSVTSVFRTEHKHVSKHIPEFKHNVPREGSTPTESYSDLALGFGVLAVALCGVVLALCGVVVLAVKRRLFNKNKMPSDAEDVNVKLNTQEFVMPQKQSLRQENENSLRKRTPASKNPAASSLLTGTRRGLSYE